VKAAVRAWDPVTAREERKLDGEEPIHFAVFGPGGNCVVTVRHVNSRSLTTACLWDATTGKRTASLVLSKKNPVEVTTLTFSPDGKRLVVCATERDDSGTKLVTRWITAVYSVPDGNELLRLTEVEKLAFNHNGTAVALIIPDPDGDRVTVRGFADLLKRK
jgi:WD40 repeat protein